MRREIASPRSYGAGLLMACERALRVKYLADQMIG